MAVMPSTWTLDLPRSSFVTSPDVAPDAEHAWVERARAGDSAAFELLYQRHGGRTYALCVRLCADPTRARELAHDAFVRAWERLGSFRGDAAFGTWLHRLTVNVVLEAARRDQRRRARVEVADDPADLELAASRDSDPLVRMQLEEAIAALPPNARMVFVLHDVEGYSHQEIAERMELAAGTVRAHLHRARQLLMKHLG